MNVVTATNACAGWAFTATSSCGLSFMHDVVQQASSFRVQVVLAITNHEIPGILAVSEGRKDIISTRDTGWLQIIVEGYREIFNNINTAFWLGEDYDIQFPVVVNCDGFNISYLAQAVKIAA